MTDFLPPVVLKLDADISGFVRKLAEADAALKAFGRNTKTQLGDLGEHVRKDMDKAGEKAGKSLAAGMGRGFTASMKGLLNTFKFAGLASLIGGAGPLAGALEPLVGLSGLAPGGIAALGASIATLVIGLRGVKGALAQSGDPGLFAAALAKLAPAAQSAVRALAALKPAMHDLRMEVQQNLFAGLADSLKQLGGMWLPMLKTGLGQVAGGFNDVFRNILQVLTTDGALSSMSETLSNIATSVHKAAGGFQGFITGFLDLARVGSTFLPQMGQGFTNLGDKFAQWTARVTSDGSFAKFIQGGLDAFRQLLPLLHDVGSIVGSVVKALGAVGPGLGPIGVLLHQLAVFFDSAQGMQALLAIVTTLAQLSSLAGGIIMAILPPLAQILVVLSGALTPIINILSTQLMPIITQILGTLGQAFIPVIVAVAASLAEVLVHLMPFIQVLADNLGPILLALAPVLAQMAISIGEVLVQALDALLPAFTQLLPVFTQLAVALLPSLVPLIRILADMLIITAPIVKVLATILAEVLAPILRLITPLLGALVVPLTWIANHMDHATKVAAKFGDQIIKVLTSVKTWRAVGKWFTDVWHTIVHAFETGLHWVEALPGKIWAALKALPGFLRRVILEAADAFFVGIGKLIGYAIRGVMRLPGVFMDGLRALGGLIEKGWHWALTSFHEGIDKLIQIGKNLWKTVTGDAKAGTNTFMKFLDGLPDRAWHALVDLKNKIVGFMKDAGKWLWDTGKDLVTGFINGAETLADWAIDGVKRIINDILKGVKSVLGIKSPSTVFADYGKQVILGFVKGIEDNAGGIRTSILRVVGWKPDTQQLFERTGGAGYGASYGGDYVPISVHLGGTQMAAVHAALIPAAQRYKQRTGTTGMI